MWHNSSYYKIIDMETNKGKLRVWLWHWEKVPKDQTVLRCGSSAKTIKDFRPYESKEAVRKAYREDSGKKGFRIPDAYWAFTKEMRVGDIVVNFDAKRGNPNFFHLLYGWGVVTTECTIDETNENPMQRGVEWHVFFDKPFQNREMGNSFFFQGTTDKQAQQIKELLSINTDIEMESKYQKYRELLETNKNLILTGAPGTGKTFMAKAIAEEMGAKVGFVQFHPSYDYTDFVEGLRPKNDDKGNVGFERRDGVFKAFCKSALDIPSKELFEDTFNQLVEEVKEGKLVTLDAKTKPTSKMSINEQGNIVFDRPTPNAETRPDIVSLNTALNLFQKYPTSDALSKVTSKEMRQEGGGNNTYRWAVVNEIVRRIEQKALVFIIDEINRGEISKIFGELFFSIDPSYRGVKGKVNTQYQNMIEDGDKFKDGFYIPENVYIIGTMNDIDRSVESMDFAMRRRFAWKEVTAKESMQMLDGMENEKALKARMGNLNGAILNMNGLGKAYQIGVAYFKKYEQYFDFEKLWQYHLEGLLAEYLRGSANAKTELDELKKAYNNESPNDATANNDNGQ